MRKIQFAIVGFVTGVMVGLLLGLAEMRLFKSLQHSAALPFVIGFTVIMCIITGIRIGLKRANY